MNAISFYEKLRTEQDRIRFKQTVEAITIPYYSEISVLSTNIPNILFIHEPDFSDIKQSDSIGNQKIKPEFNDSWIILFGGNNTSLKTPTGKVISYIKYSELQERIVEIKAQLEMLNPIDSEALINIILGFDPTLEELLKPFEKASPFANTKELKTAKVSLNEYVTNKIGQNA